MEGVDLHVGSGEVLGLVGPNGGGKSTVLMMLAGLVRPSSGRVTVGGTPAFELALAAAGTVGLITAEPGLYPALTIRENLHWFAGLYGRAPAEVDAALPQLCEGLDLWTHLDRRAGDLSSGQRQKASLVRALLLRPAVLLFDEPTANLDPLSARAIHLAIRERADAGIAVVLCTHDLYAAEHVCDRVAVLNRTLRALETFDGPRSAPEPGRLHALLAAAAEPA
ncbi:MAG: ABC transporter ATP-binding protein [Alphaproteobacteria bacterium]|nr:ABC transporter ATP-binding protein [Alphaproteobacteria bacterium]